MPPELARLDALLTRGLNATAALWAEIETAYAFVHRAAHLLANPEGLTAAEVCQAYEAFLTEMRQQRDPTGRLAAALTHFLKVSDSYKPHLFHCYSVPNLPRTNNDLEQYFGRARYLERRASGRKLAAPSLVIRGSVRLIAAVATYAQPLEVADLAVVDRVQWRALRRSLEAHHETRRAQRRFRRDPRAYLAALENLLLKPPLPS